MNVSRAFIVILVFYLILGWFLPVLPLYGGCDSSECSTFEWKTMGDIFYSELNNTFEVKKDPALS